MSAWAEKSEILSELQNGFRPDRHLEDNLFVLAQTIEVAWREPRGLLGCFLDVAKTYDSVPHEELFRPAADATRVDRLSQMPIALWWHDSETPKHSQ